MQVILFERRIAYERLRALQAAVMKTYAKQTDAQPAYSQSHVTKKNRKLTKSNK